MQPTPSFHYDAKADAIYFFLRPGNEEECIEILKASQFLEQIVRQRKARSTAQTIP